MSLTTCCPSCGTRFRVVADQLRISDGWVRCGRCQEVFDARQALQRQPQPVSESAPNTEMVRSSTLPAAAVSEEAASPALSLSDVHAQLRQVVEQELGPEPAPAPAPVMQGYELPVPPQEPDDFWLEVPVELPSVASRRSAAAPASSEWAPDTTSAALSGAAVAREEAEVKEQGDTAPERQAPVTPTSQTDAVIDAQEMKGDATEPTPTQEADLDAQAPLPSFVKQAQRKAWWSHPVVRFFMGMLLIFLPLTLVLQVAVHERNALAAWKPQWTPALERMCVLLQCQLAPRRDIASVVLTGSSFHQEAQAHRYQLGLSIQNQGELAVATPAVELTLTDAQDQVLVRKVLTPLEIGAPEALAAHSEWNGTLPLQTQGLNLPVAGYRVTAFYP